MKAQEFVKKAKDIAENYKTLYVMGCFGAPLNEANKKRYIAQNDYNKQKSRQKMINNATSDTFGFDCVNTLKAIFWGWNGDKNANYGGAYYPSKNHPSEVPDVNADTMFSNYCKKKSSEFKSIKVGEFLWMNGHIGIYIGNGLAVECTPAWKNKVQITAVGNIGKVSGYKTRKWKQHGESVFIDYKEEPTPKGKYYPKYTGNSVSIVDALISLNINSTFTHRKQVAKANGISLYIGSAKQNRTLLNLLKLGQLKKES